MDFWNMNIWKIFLAGGPIMWILLVVSILALAIVIEKFRYLRRIRIDTKEFLNGILDMIKKHNVKEAVNSCDTTKSPIGPILKAGILKHGRSREQIKEAVEDAALYEVPFLEKNLGTLALLLECLRFWGF